MQNPLIAELVKRYPNGAACASALGISRQAFNAALARGRLSTACALRAADLLCIDKGVALLSNADHPPAPILNPGPDNWYYVKPHSPAKSDREKCSYHAAVQNNIHVITSKSQNDALDLIRWVFAVAKLPADSPRFCWYVSRWDVPGKIARAKAAGTFDESVSRCPPIDPTWTKLVPAALKACDDYAESIKPPTKTPQSSGITPATCNRPARAA